MSSGVSRTLAAPTFSARWARLPVPGMGEHHGGGCQQRGERDLLDGRPVPGGGLLEPGRVDRVEAAAERKEGARMRCRTWCHSASSAASAVACTWNAFCTAATGAMARASASCAASTLLTPGAGSGLPRAASPARRTARRSARRRARSARRPAGRRGRGGRRRARGGCPPPGRAAGPGWPAGRGCRPARASGRPWWRSPGRRDRGPAPGGPARWRRPRRAGRSSRCRCGSRQLDGYAQHRDPVRRIADRAGEGPGGQPHRAEAEPGDGQVAADREGAGGSGGSARARYVRHAHSLAPAPVAAARSWQVAAIFAGLETEGRLDG